MFSYLAPMWGQRPHIGAKGPKALRRSQKEGPELLVEDIEKLDDHLWANFKIVLKEIIVNNKYKGENIDMADKQGSHRIKKSYNKKYLFCGQKIQGGF